MGGLALVALLILSPTREIALQTQATLEIFGTPLGIRSISLIGGIDMRQDAKGLATYPQVIVATPGRLLALGLVGLVRVVPVVVFSLISGVVADAWNRRRLMLFTQIAATLVATALGILAFHFSGRRSAA